MSAPLTTEQVEEILRVGEAVTPGWEHVQAISSLATELLALRKRVGELERTVEFVTRWAWRERTNGPLTDAERLSAIKFHPAIKPALPTPKEPS